MADRGRGLLMAALFLFLGAMLFYGLDAGIDVDFLGGIGGTFLFFAFILFIAALFSGGSRGATQQQQQQVVVVRRGRGGAPATAVQRVKCPSCTRVNPQASTYCQHCGAHLGTA